MAFDSIFRTPIGVLLVSILVARYWGEPVVCACIEGGIDYLDVCGEPEFIERMQFRYNESASQQGSLVVSACGFDSVPADLGVIFAVHESRIASPPSILSIHSFPTHLCASAGC